MEQNHEFNNPFYYEEAEWVQEALIVGSELKNIKPREKVLKAICKIKLKNEEQFHGTGSLIKYLKNDKKSYYLMTCEHVIEKQMIKDKNEIEVAYDNEGKRFELKLGDKERFIRDYKYIGIDAIILFPGLPIE
jgi:hypothetical protein